MSKDVNSKKKTWEKLSQVGTEASADKEPVIKEESAPEDKTESISNKLPHPSYEALEKQLAQTEIELEEYKSKLIQSYADIQNKEKRFERQIESIHKFSQETLLNNLLPIKDNLEKAVALLMGNNEKKDPTLEGIQLTLKDLQKVLENNGVKTIDPKSGESFDAHFHQAMTTRESTEQNPNTIIEVLQKGYLLHGRLLRPAWVVVAKATKQNTSDNTS